MALGQSSRRIEAESSAERNARYELKLLCFRRNFITFMNLSTSLSLSFGSCSCRMRVLHQKLMALKCLVNLTRLGDFSSFCSFDQSSSSVGSSFQKCCASSKVICSAKSDDLKCRS